MWLVDQWQQLRDEARRFPSKDAAVRIVADLISVNTAMVLAFVLWQFALARFQDTPRPASVTSALIHFVTTYALIWCVIAIAVFQAHGFYTRTRGYASPYKILVIVRAITLTIIAFVFADYFIYAGVMFPRGLAFVSWLLLLVTVGGSRAVKDWLVKLYTVEPARPPIRKEIVLVVGGAGYLGSALVPLLVDNGYRVRVLDSLLFGKESLRGVAHNPHFELIAGDTRDIRVVVQAMKGCHSVVHLAAIVGDPACEENPQLAAEVNRAATRMLIDVSRGFGIERFLFASTCSVYGASEFLMDEQAQVAPISLYARTKLDSEQLLLEAQSGAFHPTILRLATLFGVSPRPRFDLVVNLLTARAIRAGKITIFNGEQWRPFMHVFDAARAFQTCLDANNLHVISGEIFNAGSYGLNHRLSEVAQAISGIVPTVEVERVENADRRNYRVTFDKIHTRLGFTCERSLEQGIREMAEMVRSSPVADFNTEMFNNRAMTRLYAQTDRFEASSIRLLESLARVSRSETPEPQLGQIPPPVTPLAAAAAAGASTD
jgi:nucleoside-diphosphate-sugar epimerase